MAKKQTPLPGYNGQRPYTAPTEKQTILKRGTRTSVVDPTVDIRGLKQLLAIWEANRKHRLKSADPATIAGQLHGLFGRGR